MNFNIFENIKKHKLLIAAHRGFACGNIPCNTPYAFTAALNQGADIIELDVSISADKKLFVFHPGMEPYHLKSDKHIADMTCDEINKLRYHNFDGVPTQFGVSRLEDILALLKGKCYINIDKFWTCMPEITAAVKSLNMSEQIIVKTAADKKWFNLLESLAIDFAYMPIIEETDDCSEYLLSSNINYIGAEVLFKTDSSPVASDEYIEKMHNSGLVLWVNSIVYDYTAVIAAGHNDDIAVSGSPDCSWGWLAKKGFDIIQTDWAHDLKNYCVQKGYINI